MARHISNILQKYTQRGGARPFGLSLFVSGMSKTGEPKLFQLTPAGSIASWKANSIGKGSDFVNEFLKKNYEENMTVEEGSKLMMRCLYEVIDNPKENSDIAIIDKNGTRTISDEERAKLCSMVEQDNKK